MNQPFSLTHSTHEEKVTTGELKKEILSHPIPLPSKRRNFSKYHEDRSQAVKRTKGENRVPGASWSGTAH